MFTLSWQKRGKNQVQSCFFFFSFLKDDCTGLVNVKLTVNSGTIFRMIIFCGPLLNIKYMTSSLTKEKCFKPQRVNFPEGNRNAGRNTQQNNYGIACFSRLFQFQFIEQLFYFSNIYIILLASLKFVFHREETAKIIFVFTNDEIKDYWQTT